VRPRSILLAELCFVAMIGANIFRWLYSWPQLSPLLTGTSPLAEELRSQIILFAASNLIYGLLFYFVVRRASRVAKWLAVALFAFNVVTLAVKVAIGEFDLSSTRPLALVSMVFYGIAIWLLFRPDSKLWFEGRGRSDLPDVFG